MAGVEDLLKAEMSSTREIAGQCHISVRSMSNIKRKMNLNIKGHARFGKYVRIKRRKTFMVIEFCYVC